MAETARGLHIAEELTLEQLHDSLMIELDCLSRRLETQQQNSNQAAAKGDEEEDRRRRVAYGVPVEELRTGLGLAMEFVSTRQSPQTCQHQALVILRLLQMTDGALRQLLVAFLKKLSKYIRKAEYLDLSSPSEFPKTPSPGHSPVLCPSCSSSPQQQPQESSSSPSPFIMCRICEQLINRNGLERHVTECESRNKHDMISTASDERLRSLLRDISKARGKARKSHCMDAVMDLCGKAIDAHDVFGVSELKFSLASLTSTSSCMCPLIQGFVDRLQETIRDKKEAIVKRDGLSAVNPPALEAGSLFLHSPKLHPKLPSPAHSPKLMNKRPNQSSGLRPRSMSIGNLSLKGQQQQSQTAVTLSDFEIIKPLTRGSYGNVYIVRKESSGDVFAMKVLNKNSLAQKNALNSLRTEMDVLAKTSNDYIVRLFYCFSSEEQVHLVMEYLPGGDLFSFLQGAGPNEEYARFFIAEIVLALEYLHSQGIVHRDLKPDNVLLDKNGHIKLTDFGLSKTGLLERSVGQQQPFHNNSHHKRQPCKQCEMMNQCQAMNEILNTMPTPRPKQKLGTPDYMAPEVLLGLPHGPAVDWWALGCVLFELIVGVPPFSSESVPQIFDRVLNRQIQWPSSCDMSPEAKDLIDKLLATAPNSRLGSRSVDDIKMHHFFDQIDWITLRQGPAIFVPSVDSEIDTCYFEPRNSTFPLTTLDMLSSSSSSSLATTSISPKTQVISDGDGGDEPELFWVNFSNLATKTREALSHHHQQQQETQQRPRTAPSPFAFNSTPTTTNDVKPITSQLHNL